MGLDNKQTQHCLAQLAQLSDWDQRNKHALIHMVEVPNVFLRSESERFSDPINMTSVHRHKKDEEKKRLKRKE